MNDPKNIRVMWLLNHTTARHFEIAMLKKLGIKEVFLPKIIPKHVGFRSTSVDYSEDKNLTIPESDLNILNAENWHENPSRKAWDIANRHFDLLFFMLNKPDILRSISKNFKGIVLWRAYGWQSSFSYTRVMADLNLSDSHVRSLGDRFYFAQAYDHLHEIEADFLKNRQLFLPAGLKNCQLQDQWCGSEKKIFLVLPGITVCNYYKGIYNHFISNFREFPYVIGGSQSLKCDDPNVLGFIPKAQHTYNMQQMRVMFYPGAEPNHVHYHPFEAVAAGMPLVFMAGGLLDKLGGQQLPGRCKSIKEARGKLKRILNDDWNLIDSIRKSQVCLLELMKEENCFKDWQFGFQRILSTVEKAKTSQGYAVKKKIRIAVLVTDYWRGGPLTNAKLLARAIVMGSKQTEESVDVILGHLDAPNFYTREDFDDLPPYIQRRPFTWRTLTHAEANRAIEYSGNKLPSPDLNVEHPPYFQVPDDGIKQFMDCDLLILIGDKLEHPLLPIQKYALMITEYAERYTPKLDLKNSNRQSIMLARKAQQVFVTTEFTRQDAIQFAQLPDSMVIKLPMLINELSINGSTTSPTTTRKYFLWSTNQGINKNHQNALEALRLYYEKYAGKLECHVTGVGTPFFLKTDSLLNLETSTKILAKNSLLKKYLKILGELPLQEYMTKLAGSIFLWNAARIDNGSYTALEGAQLGIPILSSDYPAMREIALQHDLSLVWMDPDNPQEMAKQLKEMEIRIRPNEKSTSPSSLSNYNVEQVAHYYWEAIKECL